MGKLGNTNACKLTDAQVREAAKRIRASKGTVSGEARRLGCYHATLRRAVRELLGAEEYDKLPGLVRWRGVSVDLTAKAVREVINNIKAGSSFARERKRVRGSRDRLLTAIKAVDAEFAASCVRKRRTPKPPQPPADK